MSVDTADTKLASFAKDAMLGRPHGAVLELLYQRQEVLLDMQPVTPAAHAEARCISRLLAKGTLGSHQVLEVLLEVCKQGATFPLIDEHADLLNPIIWAQHVIWNNLVTIICDGEMPEPPVTLSELDPRSEEQLELAKIWWELAGGALQTTQKLGTLPTAAAMDRMPPFVGQAVLRASMEGPHLVGFTLYVQQTTPSGVRQSTDHGALEALANALTNAVVLAAEKLRSLEPGKALRLLERVATDLAWHRNVLRGFVAAAIGDPELRLQAALVGNETLLDRIRTALSLETSTQSTISWEGSTANPLNVAIGDMSGNDLTAKLTASVEEAKGSPLNQTPR